MWKNVSVNFLALSFIIFSGQYLHYRIELKNALKKTPVDKIDSPRSDISGAFYGTSHPISISGIQQHLNARTFHICGKETTDKGITITILKPTDKTTTNNLITTSSS
jgi:type IV secretory pathway ATPase VirB11/archaellum biosynthesis ATPase